MESDFTAYYLLIVQIVITCSTEVMDTFKKTHNAATFWCLIDPAVDIGMCAYKKYLMWKIFIFKQQICNSLPKRGLQKQGTYIIQNIL